MVVQPSYFETLGKLIATTSVADWRGYFRYKLLTTYAPDLPAKFVQLHFEFTQRTVSGIEEIKPRWKRAVDTVDGAVGDLVGKMYVERHFSPDAKRRMDELVGNLMQAYAQRHRLARMDDAGDQTKSARQAGALHDQDRLSVKVARLVEARSAPRRSGRQRHARVGRWCSIATWRSSAARSIAPNGS